MAAGPQRIMYKSKVAVDDWVTKLISIKDYRPTLY